MKYRMQCFTDLLDDRFKAIWNEKFPDVLADLKRWHDRMVDRKFRYLHLP